MPEAMLWDLINECEARLNPKEQRFWEFIKIEPKRWSEPTHGNQTGGFWAVAAFGDQVLWYNEIEDGFNLSRFTRYGEIGEYWCDQLDLNHWIAQLCSELDTGSGASYARMGPPKPLD